MATAFETFVNDELPNRIASQEASQAAGSYPRYTGVAKLTEERTPAEMRSDLVVAFDSLRVTAGAGLSVDYEDGFITIDETYYFIASDNLAGLTDATTNYVFVNNSGVVVFNTTGFPTNSIPMAEVATAGGAITSVGDRRAFLYGHHGPAFAGTVTVDTINEYTPGAGVTIEGNYFEDGQLALGSDASAIAADSVLWLSHTWTGSPGATAKRGALVGVVYNFDAASTGFNVAARFDAEVLAGNNQDFDWLFGCIATIKVRGTGSKAVVEAVKAQIYADENNAVAGDVIYFSAAGNTTGYTGSTAVGVWGLEINDLGAGFNSISGEMVAIEVLPQDAKGAAVAYGVQIGDITNATTVIPIYQSGTTGHNRILADTHFGADSAPDSPYTVHIESTSDQVLKIESTAGGAVGARMDFAHSSASPADWDQVMNQYYYGRDSLDNVTAFGLHRLYAVTVADGSEAGRFEWQVAAGWGALVSSMVLSELGQLRLPVVGANAGILVGGDTQLYRNAANVLRTPDSVLIDGTLTVGTAPDYTVTNTTTDRTFDANDTTIDELADVLGTLIADLITIGLLQ